MTRRSPRRTGRPLALTDDIETRFLNAIRLGVPGKHAAAHAGITQRSIEKYAIRAMHLEEDGTPEHEMSADDRRIVEFIGRLTKARADGVARNVGLIQKVAAGEYLARETRRTLPDGTVETERVMAQPDWRASAFILERMYPQDFGKNAIHVELTDATAAAAAATQEQEVPQAELVGALAERVRELAQRRATSGEDDITDAEVVD